MSTNPAPLEAQIKPSEIVRERTQAAYHFSPPELADLGKKLAMSASEKATIESELDSIKQSYKGKIAAVELAQDSLCQRLRDGFEMRETPAIIVFNRPAQGRKSYFREPDSFNLEEEITLGEFIKDEPMSAADWQLPIFRNQDGKDATLPVIDAGQVNLDPVPETAEDRARNREGATEFLSTEGEGTKEDLGGILDVPNAGQTPIGEALHQAAAQKELPRVTVALDASCTAEKIRMQFSKAAKKAGWPVAAIDLLDEEAKKLEGDITKTMGLYSAHIATAPEADPTDL